MQPHTCAVMTVLTDQYDEIRSRKIEKVNFTVVVEYMREDKINEMRKQFSVKILRFDSHNRELEIQVGNQWFCYMQIEWNPQYEYFTVNHSPTCSNIVEKFRIIGNRVEGDYVSDRTRTNFNFRGERVFDVPLRLEYYLPSNPTKVRGTYEGRILSSSE